MQKYLEDFYYGDIQPNLKDYCKSKQYSDANAVINDVEEKLTELLNQNEKHLFLDFVNAHDEIVGVARVESFISGFRIGANIMLEILSMREQD